jgi:predicted SprT family Zn-dependent metalloprotease
MPVLKGIRQTARVPFVSSCELTSLYAQINAQWFQNALPLCEIRWSRQLTRAAGNIDVKNRIIKLSFVLLSESFDKTATGFEVCGVFCASREAALLEILKHEMIHLYLFEQKLPHGHTAAFRAKAREIGQRKTRHGIALPLPSSGWIYRCVHCDAQIVRRRRFGRPVACAKCCKIHNGGRFDARFRLTGRKITSAATNERALTAN